MSNVTKLVCQLAKVNQNNLTSKNLLEDIYYLDTSNITRNKIEVLQHLKLKNSSYPSRAKRKVKDKTIIYSTVRPEQEHFGIMDHPQDNLIVSTGFTTLDIIDPQIIDPLFLYYYLTQPRITQRLDKIAKNSVSSYPSINPSDIGNILISFPKEIIRQQNLVKIIFLIDKKIELNNQINTELESMAKTLYDYWFVQFDFPDENGKPYKSSGGKMVYNSVLKREIPDGWNDSQIGKIENKIITGKTPPKGNSDYFSGDVPFITIGDIRGNTFIVNTEETLSRKGADFQKSKYLPEDTICVTCIATPGLVGLTTTLSQTNQQINSIICSKEYHKYFLYFALKSYFNANSKVKIGNTFANMNKRDFSEIGLIYPSESLLIDFHKKVSSIFEKIKSNTKESRKIYELRDFLLPMLMNGQVTITE